MQCMQNNANVMRWWGMWARLNVHMESVLICMESQIVPLKLIDFQG